MKYHELQVKTHRDAKRLGRGIGSGKGKTAGRGTKGAGARQGYKKRPGFEGGQTPIMQHLPKLPGFTNMRPKAENIFTGQLEQFAGKMVDAELLYKNKLITSPYVSVKLLSGKGDLTKKVSVKVQAISASALVTLQQAGGSFEAVPRAQRPSSKQNKA